LIVNVNLQGGTNMSNTNELKGKRNPKEFTYFISANNCFALENHFSKATFDNNDYPLEIYGSFSRLKGCIISSEKGSVTFNIPYSNLGELLTRSNFAMTKEMENEIAVKKSENESLPCYTVRFTAGKLKGKTPAEVLFEDANNTEVLNEQYKFLKKNADKYPNNRKIMDAIKQAATLFKEGKLSADNISSEVVIPIFNSGLRPLVRKKDNNGNSFVYTVSINWHLGAKSPCTVEVANFYAPVVTDDKGLFNVQAKKKTDEVILRTDIPFSAWIKIHHAIESQMRNFEMISYNSLWKIAEEQDAENRNAAK
jgi:hypothetical protein